MSRQPIVPDPGQRCVVVDDLRLRFFIGVHEFEKRARQEVSITVHMFVAEPACAKTGAPPSDELADYVSYADIVEALLQATPLHVFHGKPGQIRFLAIIVDDDHMSWIQGSRHSSFADEPLHAVPIQLCPEGHLHSHPLVELAIDREVDDGHAATAQFPQDLETPRQNLAWCEARNQVLFDERILFFAHFVGITQLIDQVLGILAN